MDDNSEDGDIESPVDADNTADSNERPAKKEKPLEPGPILNEGAKQLGISVDDLIVQLMHQPTTLMVPTKKGPKAVKWLPGNTLEGKSGPTFDEPIEVLIIGKMPSSQETMANRLFNNANGKLLRNALARAGLPFCGSWYMTNVLRFMPPDVKRIPAVLIKECSYILEQEIQLLKPKFILALGSDAVKALYGRSANLKKLRGATDLTYKDARVMVTTHPSAVVMEPSLQSGFERDIQTFAALVQGKDITRTTPKHYESVTTLSRLIDIVQEIIQYWDDNPTVPKRLAVDCEWGGTDGSDFMRSTFRSIQFTHRLDTGYCIVLTRAGLVYDPATCVDERQAAEVLRVLLDQPGVQVGGHNFRSDLLRLKRIGLDCMDQFMRGIDTMLAYHLVYPAEEGFGLEQLAVRFTDLGRYDLEVEAWLVANKYKSAKGAKSAKSSDPVGKQKLRKFGYAHVPDELLFPVYSPADVDVVMYAWHILEERLQQEKVSKPYVDVSGRNVNTLYDLYYTNIHLANIPLEEIEATGMDTDTDRLKRLTELFTARRDEMLNKFRDDINWPDFNHRSTDQLRRFLFGGAFGKKVVCPAGAITLSLQPIKTTEKPSRDWSRVRSSEIEDGDVQASTDGETLMILKHQDEKAGRLQKIKFVDQIIKNFLRAPNQAEDGDEVDWDEGLIGLVSPDSRMRTTLSQLTDTGRYRSYEPNMQNLPKKQEAELRLIFSPDPEKMQKEHKNWQTMTEQELKDLGLLHPGYFSIRSCFRASKGHVLIEADYKQAELNVMAHLSGDPDMIAIMNDPKRDLHSEMAVSAFNLTCKPEEVKKLHSKLRIVAKATNFGGRCKSLIINEL